MIVLLIVLYFVVGLIIAIVSGTISRGSEYYNGDDQFMAFFILILWPFYLIIMAFYYISKGLCEASNKLRDYLNKCKSRKGD